ncbi:MAG TPA: hypothetical protein VF747_08475, partial [Blastocatellia bacterium]
MTGKALYIIARPDTGIVVSACPVNSGSKKPFDLPVAIFARYWRHLRGPGGGSHRGDHEVSEREVPYSMRRGDSM